MPCTPAYIMRIYTYMYICMHAFDCLTVLEIMVSIQTVSDHFGILSDLKNFGSEIWLSTTISFYMHTVVMVTKLSVLRVLTYIYFHNLSKNTGIVAHVYTSPKVCPSKAEIVRTNMITLGHLSIHHLLLISNSGLITHT